MSFESFGFSPEILRAVEAKNYHTPTPIQEKAIPHVLEGKDLLGCAQTGTGKTAAFALPILQRLAASASKARSKRPIRALVLTPTRELATQIGDSFGAYGRHTPLRCTVVYGGVSQGPQAKALHQGVDILVATPGRLLDLMSQGLLSLRALETFVLDEADRMLDMGFIHDIRRVIDELPDRRQTLFFSATMPDAIRGLADSILRDPVEVAVTPVSSPAELVEHFVCYVEKPRKGELLRHLLEDGSIRNALVFTRTKHGADRVERQLSRSGVRAESIHGDKSQKSRERALAEFKRGSTRVLVATDIAARGLDIVELSHVINFDLPVEPEAYIHRIGRTGRAGASGTAMSFCSFEERPLLAEIERLIRRRLSVTADHPFRSDVPPGPPTDLDPGRKQRAPRPYMIRVEDMLDGGSGQGAGAPAHAHAGRQTAPVHRRVAWGNPTLR